MKLLLYCTKAKPYLIQGFAKPMHTLDTTNPFNYYWKLVNKGFSNDRLNGKIVGECDFEVEKLSIGYGVGWQTESIKGTEKIEKLSCLTRGQLYNYCQGRGYAIHIKNLTIFDEPKELNEYYNNKQEIDYLNSVWENYGLPDYDEYKEIQIKKAPQNMMNCYDGDGEHKILISIRPEWLCKILNGEKTIEVRKKVLKDML